MTNDLDNCLVAYPFEVVPHRAEDPRPSIVRAEREGLHALRLFQGHRVRAGPAGPRSHSALAQGIRPAQARRDHRRDGAKDRDLGPVPLGQGARSRPVPGDFETLAKLGFEAVEDVSSIRWISGAAPPARAPRRSDRFSPAARWGTIPGRDGRRGGTRRRSSTRPVRGTIAGPGPRSLSGRRGVGSSPGSAAGRGSSSGAIRTWPRRWMRRAGRRSTAPFSIWGFLHADRHGRTGVQFPEGGAAGHADGPFIRRSDGG